MKVYAGMDPAMPLDQIIAHAKRVEALGYDGLHVPETIHDAMAVSLLVAEHTSRLIIRTSVALAFVRSPTLTAYSAWDISKFSDGRFELGLGTQIRQNIEGRYAMPWSDPIQKMRDYVGALGALFAVFRTGGPIDFESPNYRLNRMQPYFNPGPDETTPIPKIYLGGVNTGVCRLAGAKADGFVTHPTNSNPRYLEELCLPALREGATESDRDLDADDFQLVIGTQVLTGSTQDELQADKERQRRLFAFLYSTPAYATSLKLYGWQELASQLQTMVRQERWDELHNIVSDEILETFIPSGTYQQLPDILATRFANLGQGILLAPPTDVDHDRAFSDVVKAVQAI